MGHAIFPQINDCNFFKKRRKKKSTEKAGSWLGRSNTHHARTRTIIWDPTIHKAGQCTCDPSAGGRGESTGVSWSLRQAS